jgi:adenylate kinase family enzyme
MRIHISGASGCGVTTLGRALAGRLRFSYFDADDYFWEPSDPPFAIKRTPDARNRLIRSALVGENNWVLGGSVLNWGDEVFPPFDLIVFLWLPPEIRMARLETREASRYGETIRTDPARKKQYDEFMAWAADYDKVTGLSKRNIAAHEHWLNRQSAPVLEIREDIGVQARLERVLAVIGQATP